MGALHSGRLQQLPCCPLGLKSQIVGWTMCYWLLGLRRSWLPMVLQQSWRAAGGSLGLDHMGAGLLHEAAAARAPVEGLSFGGHCPSCCHLMQGCYCHQMLMHCCWQWWQWAVQLPGRGSSQPAAAQCPQLQLQAPLATVQWMALRRDLAMKSKLHLPCPGLHLVAKAWLLPAPALLGAEQHVLTAC